MNRRMWLVTAVLMLCMAEVGLTHTLANIDDTKCEGAGWTLTRERLLCLRQAAPRLEHSTRQYIALLGCAGHRRGCRAGRRRTKPKQETGIQVVVGRRENASHT